MLSVARLASARLADLARVLQLDRSVVFYALGRLWPVVAGPVTALAITLYLTAAEQGFYYTFWSLLAMRTFFELSFSIALVPFVAHEWASLSFDPTGRIEGDVVARARLGSLCRLAIYWYSGISIAFMIVIAAVGAWFLDWGDVVEVAWRSPWHVLVALSGIHLFLIAPAAVLEGCNQVTRVYLARFAGLAAGSVAVWVVLAAGGGLWAACAATGMSVVADIVLVSRHRRFFHSLFATRRGGRVAWRAELWPMQWRLAASGVVSYFAFYLFVPVVFRYHGPEDAGRMGMTWQLASAAGGLGLAWLAPRVPQFAALIARRDYVALDRLFFRVSAVSVTVTSLAGIALVALIVTINLLDLAIADRILSPQWTALLVGTGVLMQVTQCQAAYLRAHRREPLMLLSIISSLAIGALVWFFGSRHGAPGAVFAYFLVTSTLSLPLITLIWWRSRNAWHVPAESIGATAE